MNNVYIHEKCKFNNVHIIHELLLIIYFQYKKKAQNIYAYIYNKGKTWFSPYGVALVSRIDKMISLFCKRAL